MQPLSYQIGKSTCWITSIINGIMFLRNGNRIRSFEYKTLHAAVDPMLREAGVWYDYDDNEERRAFEHSLKVLRKTFRISFTNFRGREVADQVIGLDFTSRVAVCDVGNGDHSILLNGISECREWLSAFDPWWYDKERRDNKNVKFPDAKGEREVQNVRIRRDHLLRAPYPSHEDAYNKGLAYPMGRYETRFLTVMESTS